MSDGNGAATPRNRLKGYRSLIQGWSRPAGTGRGGGADVRRSPLGHINADGTPECGHAAIYTPREERFVASLEPGVRALVMVLVKDLGWITYTSCEGHPRSETAPMRRRNVGLLPRSQAEREQMTALLASAVEAVSRAAPVAGAELGVLHHTLDTEEGPRSCIDLVFYPRARKWADYAADADALQGDLVEVLRTLRSAAAIGAP